ncbi:MAG: TIGR02996 domain-containing protein [Pirellulaceae bacterium]
MLRCSLFLYRFLHYRPRVNHESSLLREIVDFPDDQGPRLIYADWLDERDNPRGELIRVQFALAANGQNAERMAGLRARESELISRHAAQWLGPLRRHLESWTFRRGFVERIKLSGDSFLQHAEQLTRAFPLREVVLTGPIDAVERLAALPALAGIRHLGFERSWLAHGAEALGRSPHLAALETLDLRNNGIGAATLRDLAHSSCLPALRQLLLGRNRGLGDDGVRLLAAAPLMRRLRGLDWSGCGVGDAGARTLATCRCLSGLDWLDLTENSISLAGFDMLLASPYRRNRMSLRIPPRLARRLRRHGERVVGVDDTP